jgi:acetylglutamate kinase
MTRLVVKVGGRVATDSATTIVALARQHEVCVVHGAGPQISADMERAGVPVEFVDGRRVTSKAALDVVRRSFEAVNAALCAAIGETAVPLFGPAIGMRAVRRGPQLGFVGEPVAEQLDSIDEALVEGRIPVVVPLAVDADDPPQLLNVNADDASTAIARGNNADELHFLTDVEGFMIDGIVVASLDVPTAEELMQSGTLDPTILPKLQAAADAARSGLTAFIGRTRVNPDKIVSVPLRRAGRR